MLPKEFTDVAIKQFIPYAFDLIERTEHHGRENDFIDWLKTRKELQVAQDKCLRLIVASLNQAHP